MILTYKATDWLELQLSSYYTPEYQFNTGTGNYTNALVTFDIPNPYIGLKAFAGVGYQYIDKAASGTDWKLGTTVSIKGVDFTVTYVDTNIMPASAAGTTSATPRRSSPSALPSDRRATRGAIASREHKPLGRPNACSVREVPITNSPLVVGNA